jgi:hypothetical protein
MDVLQIAIEILLIVLLAATLTHVIRMERSKAGIKRDRGELERLILGFDDSTRQAEAAAERLRIAADVAGRAMARQIETVANLKDDLADLIERGERLTTRIGGVVRNELEPAAPQRQSQAEPETLNAVSPRVRSQAERELLRALRVTR